MKTGESGFTLIETVLAIVVIGVGLFGVMHLFQGTVSDAMITDQAVQATALARERLERIIFDKKMNGYDYVTQANYPTVESFTAPYLPFTRVVTIQEVRATDLASPQTNSGYKRVNVMVRWGTANQVGVETLVTRWNE